MTPIRYQKKGGTPAKRYRLKGKNMSKVTPAPYFLKVFPHVLRGAIKAREALILAIVADFERNKAPCFISREELARRINESQASAERGVQTLLKAGLLTAKRKGRLRYLSTSNLYQVDTNQDADLYQNDTQSVSKQGSDLYQVDTLIRSTNQIKAIRSNNQIKDQAIDPEEYLKFKTALLRK